MVMVMGEGGERAVDRMADQARAISHTDHKSTSDMNPRAPPHQLRFLKILHAGSVLRDSTLHSYLIFLVCIYFPRSLRTRHCWRIGHYSAGTNFFFLF